MKKRAKPKPYVRMNARELADATAEFDRDFVIDSFAPPTPTAAKRLARAKQKRGRPARGRGAKAISVTVELSLLRRADALARRLKLTRSRLIEQGIITVLRKAAGE